MTQRGVTKETKWWRQREMLHPGWAESLVPFGRGQSKDLQPSSSLVMVLPASGLFWVHRVIRVSALPRSEPDVGGLGCCPDMGTGHGLATGPAFTLLLHQLMATSSPHIRRPFQPGATGLCEGNPLPFFPSGRVIRSHTPPFWFWLCLRVCLG